MVDTPWRSLLAPDRGRGYLASLSYLPLKGFRKMVTLQSYMSETAFTRWTIHGSDVPPSWDDAMRRSDSPPTK